ncbi:MAG: DUF424 family protein [Euryarchaeota archaeon]|nr:DUF424 family protein [Euryarchaeota archaeon]
MFRAKVYKQGNEVLVAASDDDIVGKVFREGRLHIKVSAEFYGTETVEADFLLGQLQACTIANLVGRRVVGLALEYGFIDAANVIYIDGVPHAQMAVMR